MSDTTITKKITIKGRIVNGKAEAEIFYDDKLLKAIKQGETINPADDTILNAVRAKIRGNNLNDLLVSDSVTIDGNNITEFLNYIGGKSRLGPTIIGYFPKNITTYVEPFSGMFKVFFKMDFDEFTELKTCVYNDFNRFNVNFYRCLKKPDLLYKEAKKIKHSKDKENNKAIFDKIKKSLFDKEVKLYATKPDYKVAAQYAYILQNNHSGYNPEMSSYSHKDISSPWLRFIDRLKDPKYMNYFKKIRKIENKDFQEVIEKYDSPTTMFFVDPPYVDKEHFYAQHSFNKASHERVKKTLNKIKGKFVLSYYDDPNGLIKELYPEYTGTGKPKRGTFRWERVDVKKSGAGKAGVKLADATELLIMNF